MLRVNIVEEELFDEATSKFTEKVSQSIDFEHSLVSVSKWESKFEKPFLADTKKTDEEVIEYIKMMVVTPNLSDNVLTLLSNDNLIQINEYIESKQTATTFNELQTARGNSEIITSELIYYWMVAFKIPFECENWHLSRLFSLVRICGIKSEKPKKVSAHEVAERNRALNEQRKAQLKTSG